MPESTILGNCPEIRSLREIVLRVALSDAPVLILGESGTGKEVVARAIHRASPRIDGRFLAVNCGAVSESLLDSELFGHARGAFTGAELSRRGLFEEASGGVIFLDEVESTPPSFQAKLLRVLEDGMVRPVGSSFSVATDVRVIAASSLELGEAVRHGRFRPDLYYRLNVVGIELPPLRDRGGDVGLLASHFATQVARALNRPPLRISDETLKRLNAHDWPGNVRELRNVIERAVLFATGDAIELVDLPDSLRSRPGLPLPYRDARRLALRNFKAGYLRDLIAAHGGNIAKAAKAASMPRQTLHRLLRELREWGSGTKL